MAYADGVDATGNIPIKILVPLFAMGLFTCCMVCHGELARLKPHPRYLTHFYLMISAGGALGGLLVGFVAPHVFPALYELQIGLGLCAVLTLVVLAGDEEYAWFRQLLPPGLMVAAAAVAAAGGAVAYAFRGHLMAIGNVVMNKLQKGWEAPDGFMTDVALIALALGALVLLVAMRGLKVRGKLVGLTVELLFLTLIGYLAFQVRMLTADYRVTVRNFYGALKVRDSGPATDFDATRGLTHGTINHGEQFLNPMRRDLPTTYYGPNTGVGVAIREKGKSKAIRVGVIGLGTGTLAAYCREGDYFRFYEINPLVLRLARTEFTFLGDCKAKLDVAMGDARLSLENEAASNINEHFDVLAVDAFSSDSIPVHLLTKEAMQVYRKHLNPDGVLAVHISNRYLDLQPVVRGLAQDAGMLARVVDTDDDDSQDVFGATWVLLTSPQSGFGPEEQKNSAEIQSKRSVPLWTDDYSNLFKILK
jgi:SAM-dependent methyltransferase